MKCLTTIIAGLFVSGAFALTLNSTEVTISGESLGASSDLKAMVQKIEAPPGTISSMTCFSTKWFEMDSLRDEKLDTQLATLKNKNPKAFYTTKSEDEDLQCFIANKLNSEEKNLLDKLLSTINKTVKSEVILLVPTKKEKKLSSIIQKNFDKPELSSTLSLEELRCKGLGDSLTPLNVSLEDFSFMRNHDRSLLRKLARAELIVGGAEAIGMGTLLLLPKSITKWDDNFLEKAKSNYKRAWSSAPVWDKDEWAINYIGHPYAGALYYNALRSQNASPLASFVFSTAQSIIWEYGIEAVAEQPSIQDLLFTSTVGSVLGELAHKATLKMRKNGMTGFEKVVVTIINPSWVLNNGYGPKKDKKKKLF